MLEVCEIIQFIVHIYNNFDNGGESPIFIGVVIVSYVALVSLISFIFFPEPQDDDDMARETRTVSKGDEKPEIKIVKKRLSRFTIKDTYTLDESEFIPETRKGNLDPVEILKERHKNIDRKLAKVNAALNKMLGFDLYPMSVVYRIRNKFYRKGDFSNLTGEGVQLAVRSFDIPDNYRFLSHRGFMSSKAFIMQDEFRKSLKDTKINFDIMKAFNSKYSIYGNDVPFGHTISKNRVSAKFFGFLDNFFLGWRKERGRLNAFSNLSRPSIRWEDHALKNDLSFLWYKRDFFKTVYNKFVYDIDYYAESSRIKFTKPKPFATMKARMDYKFKVEDMFLGGYYEYNIDTIKRLGGTLETKFIKGKEGRRPFKLIIEKGVGESLFNFAEISRRFNKVNIFNSISNIPLRNWAVDFGTNFFKRQIGDMSKRFLVNSRVLNYLNTKIINTKIISIKGKEQYENKLVINLSNAIHKMKKNRIKSDKIRTIFQKWLYKETGDGK
jgi:hypothetical protein